MLWTVALPLERREGWAAELIKIGGENPHYQVQFQLHLLWFFFLAGVGMLAYKIALKEYNR